MKSKREIFSLLGVNGTEKTTVSGILAKLHPHTGGDVLWNGTSIYKNLLNYRTIVGLCPQKSNIDPDLTIFATLEFQLAAPEDRKTSLRLIKNSILKMSFCTLWKKPIRRKRRDLEHFSPIHAQRPDWISTHLLGQAS